MGAFCPRKSTLSPTAKFSTDQNGRLTFASIVGLAHILAFRKTLDVKAKRISFLSVEVGCSKVTYTVYECKERTF